MNTKMLRTLIPLAVLLVVGVGFALHSGVGTLSAFGWGSISLICPIGALTTMLASKMVVPQAVISLVLVVIAILIIGRAFCAWICPVPVVSKLRDIFKKRENPAAGDSATGDSAASDKALEKAGAKETVASEIAVNAVDDAAADAPTGPDAKDHMKPLTNEELAGLQSGCKASGKGCASCAEKHGLIDSRHIILGGTLLSAAVFGFPVFCLICPIGLTFATILLLILLFSGGDVTWSVVVVPLLLAAEVIFFRKWCSKICPISAFMSLVAKGNRTFKPSIDDSSCLETANGATCGICAEVCEQGINPRHPERGASWSECTRCMACVESCPGKAISIPLLPKKRQSENASGSGGAKVQPSDGAKA